MARWTPIPSPTYQSAKSIAKRERVLSDNEIGEIWRAAGNAASPYGAIIRLLILTGQRRGEVAGMNWGELSDDLSSWTMPVRADQERRSGIWCR